MRGDRGESSLGLGLQGTKTSTMGFSALVLAENHQRRRLNDPPVLRYDIEGQVNSRQGMNLDPKAGLGPGW